jgi:SH3 domain (SH3b1 type)
VKENTRFFYCLSMLLIFWPNLSLAAPRIQPGPEKLPYVESKMETAQFWIDQMKRPDQVLLTPKKALALRTQWIEKQILIDVFSLPEQIPKNMLREWLKSDFSYLRRIGKYNEQGERVLSDEYVQIQKKVNLEGIRGSNSVAWGMTIRRTQLRVFPSEKILTTKPLDTEFNILMISSLRLAEPLAILQQSRDKQWYFVAASVARGWVRAEDIGRMESRAALRTWVKQARFVVVGKEATFIQWGKKEISDQARMGCKLAAYKDSARQIAFPRRDKQGDLFFVPVTPKNRSHVHKGPRPNTPRVIVEQAFLLLGEAYGWGGQGGYGDCSEFTRRIGLTCGLDLPRSTIGLHKALPKEILSGKQNKKREQLSRLQGGSSLLYLPGHIMLVLGTSQGKTFVIHNLYGIHAQDEEGAYIQRVARVVVSELSLGKKSKKGSLQQRTKAVLFFAPGLDK